MSGNMTALLNGPAGAPPAGTVSQLDDPPNYKTLTNVFPILSIVLMSLLVSIRMYTTVFITRRVGVADYSLLFALASFICFTAVCLVAGNIAPGLHMWDLRLKYLGPFFYYLRVGSILYAPTIFLIKLSILSQYIELLMPNKQPRSLYWSTTFLIGANICIYSVLALMQIWSCKPMRKAWDPLVTDGHCLDVKSFNVVASTVNVVSDTIIFLLPQAVIWRLKMPTKQKIGVSLMFFIAILAIISASIRLHFTVQLIRSPDQSWFNWIAGMLALVEMDFAIIVACLPVVGAFYRHVRQINLFSTLSTSLRGMTTWRRISAGEDTAAWSLEDRKRVDPYLDIEGNQETTQNISWVKTYGVAGSDTLAPVDEPRPAGAVSLGQGGYHISMEH